MDINMKGDIYTVYADLNALLEEICTFLNEEMKNGKLSQQSTNIASMLIQRSKVQLHEISKIVSDNDSGRYVDMQGPNGNAPEYIDMKQSDECQQELHAHPPQDEQEMNEKNIHDSCPHDSLPAQAISIGKFGYLERKEKFFLSFLEHQRKLYAGICDEWLLMYNCEKDPKPFSTFNLKLYEAKLMEKKETSFELKSKKQEKSQMLTATTKKDMIQWVQAINKISNKQEIRSSKSPSPKISSDKIYEVLNCEEEQNVPTPPQFISIKPKEKPNQMIKPVPPPRVSDWNRHKTLPEPPQIEPEETYDTLQQPELEDYDTINNYDADENNIYDVIQPKTKTEPQIEEEEIYDSIQNNNSYNDDGVLEEYHEFEEYDQIATPPVKPKLFGRDKAKLKISPTIPEKPKKSFSFKSKK